MRAETESILRKKEDSRLKNVVETEKLKKCENVKKHKIDKATSAQKQVFKKPNSAQNQVPENELRNFRPLIRPFGLYIYIYILKYMCFQIGSDMFGV